MIPKNYKVTFDKVIVIFSDYFTGLHFLKQNCLKRNNSINEEEEKIKSIKFILAVLVFKRGEFAS